MKSSIKIIKLSIVILLSIACCVIAYFMYNEYSIAKSLTQNDGEYIVVLHGLGRSSWSMQKLGLKLAKEGYRVIVIDYPTRSDTIEKLVDNVIQKEIEEKYIDKHEKINFVTHSMGGIAVRYLLNTYEYEQLNRVVMLSPPNKGSALADTYSKVDILNIILGPALEQLTTKSDSFVNTISSPDYEVGVIIGEYDGKVSIEEAKLKNMKDVLVVRDGHTFIMNNDKVIHAIINFLKKGKF
jgi:uncharacterized alpha/beta hydrolase family protein